MSKQVEKTKEIINSKLERGEKLLSVGYFRKGFPLAAFLLTSWAAFTWKFYFIGVTNKRLFIIPTNSLGFLVEKKCVDVPLSNVDMKGKDLFVSLTENEKPKKFTRTGIAEWIGVDINEFENAIKNRKK